MIADGPGGYQHLTRPNHNPDCSAPPGHGYLPKYHDAPGLPSGRTGDIPMVAREDDELLRLGGEARGAWAGTLPRITPYLQGGGSIIDNIDSFLA